MTYGIILQSKALVPEFRLSYCRIFGAFFATAAVITVMGVYVASQWTFPIPFTFTLGIGPFLLTVAVFFALAVGPRRLQRRSDLHHKVKQQASILLIQSTLLFVYLLFSFLYYRLTDENKALCVFLLPIIKLVMQHAVAWVMRDTERSQPINVVFCIGVFF